MILIVTASILAELGYPAWNESLALISTLVLLSLLLLKALVCFSDDRRLTIFNRTLNVAIFPLLIVFILNVAFRLADMLR
jgi:hypothetical protein